MVVGAGFLANVAAENPVSDRGPVLARHVVGALDGEERNAATGIEPVRFDEGPRRTGVQAGATAAAALVGEGRSARLELQIDQELAQEHVAAGAGRNHERGFAVKSEPGPRCEFALEQGSRIDTGARLDRLAREPREPVGQRGEPLFEHEVVVSSPSVTSDATDQLGHRAPGHERTITVGEGDGDHALGLGQELAWIVTWTLREVAHAAGVTGCQEFFEPDLALAERLGAREADT